MDHCTYCLQAVANIKGGQHGPSIYGRVCFYQRNGFVLIEANIKGLPQNDSGFYGFHIHDGCSCAGADFADTGSHYNPAKTQHPNHAGDLPPLMLCCGGAWLRVATDRFCLADVIGKTVVIHSMPDDFRTQPAGHAGTKIACGVICPT